MSEPQSAAEIEVWDIPVRLFHWILVALFAFLFWSGKTGGNAMEYHLLAGYTVLVLVLFRLMWGFAGSTHARFSNFLSGPGRGIAFARKLLSGAPAHSVSTRAGSTRAARRSTRCGPGSRWRSKRPTGRRGGT
jgi:cytochrome b